MKCAVKLNQQREIKKQSIDQAVHYMLIAFTQYLGDRRGYKPESICEAMRYIMGHAEAIAEGYTTLREAEEDVYEQYGIYFTDEGKICVRSEGK